MKIKRMKEVIPIALAELEEAGHDEASTGDLCRQMSTHDQKYIKRRKALTKVFRMFGIETPLPALPYMYRIQMPLTYLEDRGVIEGNFKERDDGGWPRLRMYRLVGKPSETE